MGSVLLGGDLGILGGVRNPGRSSLPSLVPGDPSLLPRGGLSLLRHLALSLPVRLGHGTTIRNIVQWPPPLNRLGSSTSSVPSHRLEGGQKTVTFPPTSEPCSTAWYRAPHEWMGELAGDREDRLIVGHERLAPLLSQRVET